MGRVIVLKEVCGLEIFVRESEGFVIYEVFY